jgi:Holliday junction DNA helicase RuvA
MIEFVEGQLVEIQPTHAVVQCGGMGFHIQIPLSTFTELGGSGKKIRLLTHLHFRENDFELYGFATEAERSLFRLLISVSGIGPRTAIGILSAVQPAEFHRAVLLEDIDRLVAIPGIGRKTAQRLMVELKDKLEAIIPTEEMMTITSGDGRFLEAVNALLALGYTRHFAEKAVKESIAEQPDLPLEDVIRQALKHFN